MLEARGNLAVHVPLITAIPSGFSVAAANVFGDVMKMGATKVVLEVD